MPNIIQPLRNLVNGSRINGIEHIYQTTKPTTRVDGNALVIGDRWWKTDDGTEWFWNGTYWLTETYNQNAHGHQSTTCIYTNVAATLNNAYALIERNGVAAFTLVWGQWIQLSAITTQHKNTIATVAESFNLPVEFVEVVRG